MKKIIIILFIIGLLFFGGLIFAAKNVDRIIASAKPTIESALTSAIGGTLSIGGIKTTIFPETAVKIDSVQVLGSPTLPDLKIDSIALKVSFSSLLKGDLNVHELTVLKPQVLLVQKATDNVKNENLTSTNNSKSSVVKNSSQPSPEGALSDLPITFNLQRFSIEGGSIQKEGDQILVSNLDINSGARFEKNIASIDRLKISANLAAKPIVIELANGSFNLTTGQIQTNGLALDIAGARTNLDLNLNQQSLIGESNINFSAQSLSELFQTITKIKPDFSIPPFDITKVNFPINIKTEGVKFSAQSKETKLSLSGSELSSTFELNGDSTDISSKLLSIKGFGGNIDSPFEFNLPSSSIKSTIQMNSINIESALNAIAPQIPVKLFGTLNNLSGTFGGSFKTNLLASAHGPGKFSITNGGIRKINILGSIINALSGIPIIGDSLKAKLSPSVLAVVSSSDTSFLSLAGSVNINKGIASLSSVELDSALFRAVSSGSFNLADKSMLFNVTANLKPELVTNLIAAGKDFEKISNPDGTITVPLIIKSSQDGMQVIPDIDKLTKGIAGKVLKEQAGKALQKVLGGKDSPAAKNIGKLFGF